MEKQNQAADHEKELSFGTYLGKKFYETAVSLGSMVAGGWAGLAAAHRFIAPKAGEVAQPLTFGGKIPGLRGEFTARQRILGGLGGLFAGAVGSGIALGYEHWVKVKREQLQVDEITREISGIALFRKTDPELKAENDRLWAELNRRDAQAKPHAEPHAPAHAEWTKKHAIEAAEASDYPREAAR